MVRSFNIDELDQLDLERQTTEDLEIILEDLKEDVRAGYGDRQNRRLRRYIRYVLNQRND